MKRALTLTVLIVAAMAAPTQLEAAPPQQKTAFAKPAAAAVASGPLTPAQRGAMTRAYVLRWGGYVQQVYKVPVGVWAQRMVPTFAHADADNFRVALKRTTYEGASAALSGVGGRLSDEQAIDSMARSSIAPTASRKLGDLAEDLVYTPVTPCRILDTRVAGGVIAGTFTRDFNAVVGAGGNFSSQGGSATDCGMVAAGQAAVVINLTAVTPTGAGFATAYPFGVTRPLASSVNYTAGAIVNNSIVVKLPSPLTTRDFTVYTFATADYVADIVGYYAPPQATAVECVVATGTSRTVAANTYDPSPFSVACPPGYGITSMTFTAAQRVVMADSGFNNANPSGVLWVYNLDSVAQSVTARAQCCRVPGR
jgi:hypothetical protein